MRSLLTVLRVYPLLVPILHQCPQFHFHYRLKGLLGTEPTGRDLQHVLPTAFPSEALGDQPRVHSTLPTTPITLSPGPNEKQHGTALPNGAVPKIWSSVTYILCTPS